MLFHPVARKFICDFRINCFCGRDTFAGASGEAFLITSVDFTGAIAGISQGNSNQIIDLGGFSSQNTDTFTVTPTYNSGTNETTLLVTDTNNSKSESVLLAGNDTTGFTWTASPDGTGGAKVVDPPATVLSARAVGIAGKPINLALANPPAANGGPVTVTVSGLPSDAQLNEGGNLGNGSWSVQTTDLTSLTVLTAFVGAMLLNVSESWANADGTIGTATIADNAEAHTPGSPIFALPSDDTLTGAGGNDLFVFAQPIGNDTIHNFNAASDQIDLMGVVNVASFHDLQIASDSNGDAVITVGSGETITLQGVDASALTASNFVFDQTPTVENSGTMTISDGAVLPLSGIVDNTGVIELNSTGNLTELVITGDGVTLEGGGQIVMSDGSGNEIVGSSSSAILTNADNTISGVGQIGTGDGNLSLINETAGIINADVAGGTLTLDTGNTIVNFGVLEASNGGTLQVLDAVTGDGSAVIAGGTMEFDAAAKIAVTFNNGAGGTNYGLLILIDPSHFTGDISGFAGTAGDLAHSDGIDVIGINLNSGQFSDSYDSSTGILTLSDGTNTEALEFVDFKGDINNFHFAEDANGTGTLITDPPGLTNSATVSVVSPDTTNRATTQTSNSNLSTTNNEITTEFGPNTSVTVNPGGDHFVFNPGIGAETVANFNWQQDTIELDQFTNAQTTEELQSLIASDAHGDAVIQLGHNDSIVLSGVTTSELQQVIQAGHVLLH